MKIVDAPGLRPTPDRVRETLFNWLAPDLVGARCLDLFAGTGALGFEALSRGAAKVDFVESAPRVATGIRENAKLLSAEGVAVLEEDALGFLGKRSEAPYDIVFLDPPFGDDSLAELCRLLESGHFVAAGSLVYLEQAAERRPPALPDGWTLLRRNEAAHVRYSLATIA